MQYASLTELGGQQYQENLHKIQGSLSLWKILCKLVTAGFKERHIFLQK